MPRVGLVVTSRHENPIIDKIMRLTWTPSRAVTMYLCTRRREIARNVTDYFDTIVKACHSHARVIVAGAQSVCVPTYTIIYNIILFIVHDVYNVYIELASLRTIVISRIIDR